jgi:hypothetical protein
LPRSGGVYTLPQSAFVANTTISSAAVNSDFSDIATALTNSIATDGTTSITGTIKFATGTSGSPSVTFGSDTKSGLYSVAANELGLVANSLGVIVNATASTASGAPTPSAAGSGYVVGDQITLTGGTFLVAVTVQVATLSGSGVATVTLVEGGRYTAIPGNPVAQGSTTGSGTGATFTVTWSTVLAVTDLSNNQLWQILGATAFFKNNIVNANSINGFLGSGGVTAYNLANSAISPNLVMVNGTLVQSNNGSAQTFALKTLSGNDPTPTNPIYVIFRDSALTTAGYSVRSVTAANSVTIPNGQTMNFSSNTAARIWVGAIDNGGTVEMWVFNASSGGSGSVSIFPLQGIGVTNTTAISGASSSGVIYSQNARTNKAYVILGYATWESGLAAPGTWNTNPTKLSQFLLGVTPTPGQLLQIQRMATGAFATGTTTVSAWATDNVPTNAMGDQYMSQLITPTSAANVLVIDVLAYAQSGGASGRMGVILCQDSTVNCLVSSYKQLGASEINDHKLRHMMQAGTTSGTTFKIRIGGDGAGTNTFNGIGGARNLGGTYNSYIEINELMA